MKLFTSPGLLLVWFGVICSVCLICLAFFFNELLGTAKSTHCDFIWCIYLYIGSKKNISSYPESLVWSIQSEIYGIRKKKKSYSPGLWYSFSILLVFLF